MYRAIQFQLRAKSDQETQLRRWSGMARWLWNQALARQQERRAAGEPYANYVAMAKWLTEWRNSPETVWLRQAPVHTQQQVLKRLDQAFQRFFQRVKAGQKPGYPRFKRRGEDPGLRFPDKAQISYDSINGRIKLPKLGYVRLRQSMKVQGQIANASITRQGSRWYVSLQYSKPDAAPAGLPPTLGLDLGVANFYTTSENVCKAPLGALATQAKRLKHYQRSVARKVKGSNNRKKAITRLANLHRRISRQREDWLHKISTKLASEHAVIAIENLKVKSMSASARGDIENPGKNVRAKAGLNRSILDQCWGRFREMLGYKLKANGGELIAVPPAYTSQRCNHCGFTDKGNRTSQSNFSCLACGHTAHADHNAAHNILAAGHAVWSARQGKPIACGGEVRRSRRSSGLSAASEKQEPTEAILSKDNTAVGIPVL